MGGLRLNTLFSTTFSIIFFFTSFSFSSNSLPSAVYISSFSIFSFNICWSLLACLGVINFNFIWCPSCLKGNVQQDWAFYSEVMHISKEDDKSSWEQYHIILLSHIVLYWIRSLLDSDESLVVTRVSPPIFGIQHCCRFCKRMQLKMGGLRLNTLFLCFLFPSSFSFLPFLFLQFPFLLEFIFLLFLFSPSAYVDPY